MIYDNLSSRQINILKAVVDEYLSSAEPVGSETLDKKYNLGISPATIRNEMVKMTKMGLLMQPHTSSGRSPTPGALRYYVDHLMKPKDMSVAEEVSVKEKIWDHRQKIDKLLREATKALAQKTNTLAITATSDGDIYYSGAANILSMPEFYDFDLTQHLFMELDRYDFWWGLLNSHTDPFDIILGDEIATSSPLSQCGYIYARFTTPRISGAIGAVGPSRLNYPVVIPIVRYVGGLISEIGSKW